MKANELQMLFNEGLFEAAKVLPTKDTEGFIIEITRKSGDSVTFGTARTPTTPRIFKTWSSAATSIKKIGFSHFYLEVNGNLEKMSVDVASNANSQTPLNTALIKSTGTKRFNANVPADLYGAVKVKAARMDVSLNDLAIRWMSDWLEKSST